MNTFAYRANTTTAYYAPGGENRAWLDQGDSGTLTEIVDCSFSGAIGGKALDMNNTGLNSYVCYTGIDNTPQTSTISVVYRYSKGTPGTAAANDNIFQLGGETGNYFSVFALQHQSSSDSFVLSVRSELGSNGGSLTMGVYNFPDTDFHDIVLTYDGSLATMYIDGVTIGVNTFSRKVSFSLGQNLWNNIYLGRYFNQQVSNHYNNEMLIFNRVLSGATVAALFTGSSRSAFYSTTVSQPINSTDPGAANVKIGEGYTFKGLSITGTYDLGTYTDPGVANVLSGTSYVFNSTTLTGTYHDPTYSDPGAANVANGISYIYNDTTQTGSLAVPTANTGAAGTVPINNIKEQIRYALFVNNTTTGAPTLDLSSNLKKRVQSVLKLNPEVIPPNSNVIPAVTVWTEAKDPITQPGIMKNSLAGKRKAELTFKVAGIVYTPNWLGDKKNDVADDEIEYLMENVERVLRAYDDLGGTVDWQFPTGVTYHSVSWDEDTHYRAGIMDLKVTLHY